MTEAMSLMDWMLCGVTAFFVSLVIYVHTEGTRITAKRFVYDAFDEAGQRAYNAYGGAF